MKKTLLALAAIFGLASSAYGGIEDPPAITVSIHGHEEPFTRVLMAAWPDGKMIWSKDQTEGGPPYLSGNVDAAKVSEFLVGVENEQVFKKGADVVYTGPDASYHSIYLRVGKKQTEMISWHELFERNPKLVATNHGIEPLDGRKREDVLREDEKGYQDFRKLWTKIRVFAKGLIPKEGQPFKEPLKLNLKE